MPNVSSGASKTAVKYSVKWFGFDGVGGGVRNADLHDGDWADATGRGVGTGARSTIESDSVPTNAGTFTVRIRHLTLALRSLSFRLARYWLVQLVLMLSMLLAAHCLRNMFMLFSREAASLETLTQNPLPPLTSAWTGYFC